MKVFRNDKKTYEINKALDNIIYCQDLKLSTKDISLYTFQNTYVVDKALKGFVLNISNKLSPRIISNEMSSGITYARIGREQINLDLFLQAIKKIKFITEKSNIKCDINKYKSKLKCSNSIDWNKISNSFGTITKNGYIAIAEDDLETKYLIIYNSCLLGEAIREYYIKKSEEYITEGLLKKQCQKIIASYNNIGQSHLINRKIKELKEKFKNNMMPYEKSYLEGQDLKDFINDMNICAEFSKDIRLVLIKHLLSEGLKMPFNKVKLVDKKYDTYFDKEEDLSSFRCLDFPCNYIDGNILRDNGIKCERWSDGIIEVNNGKQFYFGVGNTKNKLLGTLPLQIEVQEYNKESKKQVENLFEVIRIAKTILMMRYIEKREDNENG